MLFIPCSIPHLELQFTFKRASHKGCVMYGAPPKPCQNALPLTRDNLMVGYRVIHVQPDESSCSQGNNNHNSYWTLTRKSHRLLSSQSKSNTICDRHLEHGEASSKRWRILYFGAYNITCVCQSPKPLCTRNW